ncbi:MAG: CxxC-x17-CxxC domain-containing protein, partial [Candidatus Jorgensenbacteria bacterium]
DAEYLETEFTPEFLPEDIVNLPNYSVYLKLMVNGVTSRPFSAHTLPPFKVQSSETIAQEIIDGSRKRYARPRYAVEEEIAVWSGMAPGAGTRGEFAPRAGLSVQAGVGGKYPTVCSSCKKETTVPFEPQPGRPIYCQDCLAKIKSGELEPVRVMPTFERQGPVQTADMSALAGMGIEFGAKPKTSHVSPQAAPRREGGPPLRRETHEEKLHLRPQGEPQTPPANRQESRPSFEPRPSILRGARTESAMTPEEKEEHELRLSELAPSDTKDAHAPQGSREPDIAGLRDALRNALGKLKE